MIFKINKAKSYTVMSNYHLRDRNLSLKAKGILSIMLSLPPDWDYSINGLVAISKEGRTSIVSALSELKENGYLQVKKIQSEKGVFDYEYNIYETPNEDIKEKPLPEVGPKAEKESNIELIKQVIGYLNEKCNKNYNYKSKIYQQHIEAKIKEGNNFENFKKVIDIKYSEWYNNTDMNKYLRPQTLFGTKFDSYLNQQERKNYNHYMKGESL